MTRRPVAQLLLLSIVTFGIYGIVWLVSTKGEMQRLGVTDIPTSWLLIVPFANIWYMWQWSGGVEKVTRGQTSQVLTFILLALLGLIGMAIVQNELNKVAGAPGYARTPPPYYPPA